MSILTRRMTMARTGRTWLNLVTPDSSQGALLGSTAVDADGNVFVSGALSTSTTAGRAMFVTKFGPTGILLWARALDTANTDDGPGLAVDSGGNVIVAGRALTSAIVAKYGPTGTLAWSKTFGASGTEQAKGVAIDGSDNIIVVGNTSEGGGTSTGFVVKFDSSGTATWRRNLGGTGADGFLAVAVDGSDDIIAVGSTTSSPATSTGALIAKYNSAGTFQWDRLLDGSSGVDAFNAVAVDGSGNAYVAGASNGSALLAQYNSAGALQWHRTLGGSGTDEMTGIVINGVGDLILAGTTTSEGAGGEDLFTAKYSSAGSIKWQRTFGGAADEGSPLLVTGPIALTPTGDFAVASVRDEAGTTADLGAFLAVFPDNGSGTGTIAGYTYAASTLTDAAGTLTDSAISLTSSAPTFTESTSGMTDAPAALDVDFYQIIA